jgi:hypothetical protein
MLCVPAIQQKLPALQLQGNDHKPQALHLRRRLMLEDIGAAPYRNIPAKFLAS